MTNFRSLALLAIVPAILVCVTAFLRIVIVLSMLRPAIGMPETPPKTAVIGLALFLPFLLIDLIVSSVLMALGMMMMPPVTVALPIKLLMFILVDGWTLILKALVGSFH